MNYWFTSDTHFGHANIIRYCNRPWLKDGDLDSEGNWVNKEIAIERCQKMDEVLIRNWNSRVKPEDTVFHAGDFCFRNSSGGKLGEGGKKRARDYEKLLNGKIIIVAGNHDRNNSATTIIRSLLIDTANMNIFIKHVPPDDEYHPWKIPGNVSLVLCGHSHGTWKYKKINGIDVLNMSVENWNYMPVSINEIRERLAKLKKNAV